MKHVALGAYLLSGTPGYRQAGVHQYAKSLLGHLPASPDFRYSALISPTAQHELPLSTALEAVIPAARTTEAPFSRIWVEQANLPSVLHKIKADLYHGLGFVLPVRSVGRLPMIVTVFDLSFITHPQSHKVFNRAYLALFTRWSCGRAARIIAISASTQRDIVAHFAVPDDRIDVIPLGAPEYFRRPSADALAAFKAAQGIGEQAVFYLGSLEPRKNLSTLVDAFAVVAVDKQHARARDK